MKKDVRMDSNTTFPTEAIKIENLAEVNSTILSNNDTIPISTLEGTKKIPLYRLKSQSKKLSLHREEVVASTRNILTEEVLFYDIIFLEGLDASLSEDISIILPQEGVEEGRKILLYNNSPSKNAFGFVIKQNQQAILRLKLAQQKEELLFLNGEWHNFNMRSSSGMVGLDISIVGDSSAILAHKDFLLPYDGRKGLSQLDYPELCIIKRLSPDWVFYDDTLTFDMPNYTNYFLRHGNSGVQGQKKTDTMRRIVATLDSWTNAFGPGSGAIQTMNSQGRRTNSNASSGFGQMIFDSQKGVAGQEGQVSPNVGAETAPMHVMTTFYVIAR